MQTLEKPVLGLVLPCYNEEDVLSLSAEKLGAELALLVADGVADAASHICFVDDGSCDRSWQIIEQLAASDSRFRGLKLSRNYGHQYALYAGLMEMDADAVISLDADLQDDISVLRKMVELYCAGNEIVYGVRENRDSDSAFKRGSARAHYWLLAKVGIDTVPDHADFRLMSRRALQFLGEYREAHLYLRGIVPLLGLPSARVSYSRSQRLAGETKYPLRKMLGLSLQGLTSFSVLPLRIIAGLGILVFLVAVGLGAWALYAAVWGSGTTPGWASTVIPIYLLGGLQLLAIGVVGEYIGKTFIEAKRRPLYQIEKRAGRVED
ncbi:MAG: glycosyltransferase family 2 protein [Halioglobus sp.]